MPTDMKKYPVNWKRFSKRIRFKRASGQCECEGECGLHDGRDLFFPQAKRCEERHGQPAKWANGTIILTTAHLNAKGGPCQCHPLCAKAEHVKAMCQRCHLRYDGERHLTNRVIQKVNSMSPRRLNFVLQKLGVAKKRRQST